MTLLERPILSNDFCFFASNLNHTMGGFSFNIKKFAGSNDASYDAQALSNICVRKVSTVFPHIRPAGTIVFNLCFKCHLFEID